MKKTFVFVILAMFVANCIFAQNSIMDFYKAQEKALKNPNQLGGGFKKVIPIKQDVKNGFISYKTDPPLGFLIGVTESRTDMGYFVAKNGKKFVASASIMKIEGMGWSGEMPAFYELQKGETLNVTEQFLSLEKNMEMLNSLPKDRNVHTKIPQIGTTIQIGSIDPKKGENSFQLIYEMQFDVNNGMFKIVKK
jgi:hypothetical protein